jgi:prepilin-type N-terminal cleavage/methylation domain-containing protein
MLSWREIKNDWKGGMKTRLTRLHPPPIDQKKENEMNQKGMTLIEILVSLVIAAIVIAGFTEL